MTTMRTIGQGIPSPELLSFSKDGLVAMAKKEAGVKIEISLSFTLRMIQVRRAVFS